MRETGPDERWGSEPSKVLVQSERAEIGTCTTRDPDFEEVDKGPSEVGPRQNILWRRSFGRVSESQPHPQSRGCVGEFS